MTARSYFTKAFTLHDMSHRSSCVMAEFWVIGGENRCLCRCGWTSVSHHAQELADAWRNHGAFHS